MRIFLRLARYALYLALAGIVLGVAGIGIAYWLIAPRLPSVETLKDVRLQVPLPGTAVPPAALAQGPGACR